MSRPPRQTLIPNANNPRLLNRVVELVAQGIRAPKSMAEILDCELRTVHYYTQAGEWLRLLDTDPKTLHPFLTRLGLEYAYAGRDRGQVYARAVWSNDFVVQLMKGRGGIPSAEVIAGFIRQWVPDMAASTARRRATSVKALIEPALRLRTSPPKPKAHQLSLNFAAPGRSTPKPEPLDLRAGVEESPDVYRVLLRALLDNGELSLGQIRALLDASGGQEVPITGYVTMALRRGDAHRVGDHLIATWGSVWRREIAETVAGVALSDPDYRDYLTQLRAAAAGDPGAAARYGRMRQRYAGWDRRVFGESTTPERLARDLDRVLLGRPIDAFPLAGETGPVPGPTTGPFLNLLERDDLVLALPPSVLELRGGVSRVNALLQAKAQGKNNTSLPSLVDDRELVHGGLCHPGERPPRAIPDTISLRLRVLMHVPHLAMLAGLLVLHRRPDWPMRLVVEEDSLVLKRGRTEIGEVLFLLDEFASEQGWLVARRPRVGLSGVQLVEVLEGLGVATRLGSLAVLDEDFFVRLRADAEDREVYEDLSPLVDRLQLFTEAWSGQE
ncbi:MAG: hypothetical protein H6741_05805 [Alphaproteobacteria bacterium]|nr:hypothetical protein [Alphaproteobacteria bacterium]MCB9792222.1 hypothetical protein [Alphaproteobacteria bacterium]